MGRERIVFLGGVPGVGKTSIAGLIARKFGIDIVLSGDYMREFVRPLAPSGYDKGEILSNSVYDSWKNFGEKNEANIIRGFESQSSLMCKGLSAAMTRAAKNGENLILESLYINQGLIDTIKELGVSAAYLYISDFSTHTTRLNERGQYTHFNSPGSRLVAQLDVYRVIMNYSAELAKRNSVPVFDNMNFESTVKAVFDLVGNLHDDNK